MDRARKPTSGTSKLDPRFSSFRSWIKSRLFRESTHLQRATGKRRNLRTGDDRRRRKLVGRVQRGAQHHVPDSARHRCQEPVRRLSAASPRTAAAALGVDDVRRTCVALSDQIMREVDDGKCCQCRRVPVRLARFSPHGRTGSLLEKGGRRCCDASQLADVPGEFKAREESSGILAMGGMVAALRSTA